MDIVVWLRSLGLGKYEAAFRDNDIDETVLPSLTEEHLKQLGISSVGHRVKLLDAIAALLKDVNVQRPRSRRRWSSASESRRRQQWSLYGAECFPRRVRFARCYKLICASSGGHLSFHGAAAS
jgi:hypothetical protein